MTAKKILGNPRANLPTMRVAARAIHRFGPMTTDELIALLRPPEYVEGSPSAVEETLTVAKWLDLITENDAAVPKLQLGSGLEESDVWFESPAAFALIVLDQLLGDPNGTEIAELIPWFLAQDWRRKVDWSHDDFSRARIENQNPQATAFFDRWMVPLGLASPSTEAPNPVNALSWIVQSMPGRHSGIRFVERVAERLPTGPAHPAALQRLVGEDAPQPGEVFPSVAFALLQLEHRGRLGLDRDDDAVGEGRLIFEELVEGGYSNVTHVEVRDV